MKEPIALITTFGLGRTPAQIGMLDVLQQLRIEADHVVGTSLGAFPAAGLAAGRTSAEIAEFWTWLHTEMLSSPLKTLARNMTGVQARRQEAALRARIADFLPATFDELPLPLRLVATDLENGHEVRLDHGDLREAVRASAALPGLFAPVGIGGRHLIDGGLVAGMPLRDVPEDARTVIVLDTGASSVDPSVVGGYRWWQVGGLAYAHQIREQAIQALLHAGSTRTVVMLSSVSGSLMDVPQPEDAIEAGRRAARRTLDALPAELQRGIYGLPSGLAQAPSLQVLQVR